MKRLLMYLILTTVLFSACSFTSQKIEGTQIMLSNNKITVDGKEITNDNTQAVYAANDIIFYLAGQDFTYGEGTQEDAHEQSEADAHTVVHITKPGSYVLSGEISLGQIAVDLGKEAKTNPEAVVTLILNGVDISCKLAPAVIFYNVYECSESDEEKATKDVDTKRAGANVIIADGTENNISGSYVAKIYKSYELSDDGTEVIDSKKLHKYDGAFYSRNTMNITGGDKGDGILNIKAENEGLNSELHLTINGGIINITSGNDGINTNEDNVSVTTINGGTLNILCDGTTGEGDGIDSNGWLVINGGTVKAQSCATSGDAGIDSDKGIYINGGNVIASGNMLDHIAGGKQTYAVFQFLNRQSGNTSYTLKNSKGNAVYEYIPENAFTYLVVAGSELVPGDYTLWQGNKQLTGALAETMDNKMPYGKRHEMPQGTPPQMPDGMKRPEKPVGDKMPMPNGEIPRGDRPEMPHGQKNHNPDDREDIPFPHIMRDTMYGRETSTIFTIKKGGNQFVNVTLAVLQDDNLK